MRKRILDDCDGGMAEKAAAEQWKVRRSTIARIKHQRRNTGRGEHSNGSCRVGKLKWVYVARRRARAA
jgi:transposase